MCCGNTHSWGKYVGMNFDLQGQNEWVRGNEGVRIHTPFRQKHKTYLWTGSVGSKKACTLPAKQLKAATAKVRRIAAWCMVMMVG
jgi:hypothetical protein